MGFSAGSWVTHGFKCFPLGLPFVVPRVNNGGPWVAHGTRVGLPLVVPWEIHGMLLPLVLACDVHGNPMEFRWSSHGRPTGLSWDSHEMSMRSTYEICQYCASSHIRHCCRHSVFNLGSQ